METGFHPFGKQGLSAFVVLIPADFLLDSSGPSTEIRTTAQGSDCFVVTGLFGE